MGVSSPRIVATGEVSGSASAKQLPSVAVPGRVRFKAVIGNSGNVYLGIANTVTAVDGTQDATSGFELDAGDEVELAADNLDEFWIICDNAGDDLTYMVMT